MADTTSIPVDAEVIPPKRTTMVGGMAGRIIGHPRYVVGVTCFILGLAAAGVIIYVVKKKL